MSAAAVARLFTAATICVTLALGAQTRRWMREGLKSNVETDGVHL